MRSLKKATLAASLALLSAVNALPWGRPTGTATGGYIPSIPTPPTVPSASSVDVQPSATAAPAGSSSSQSVVPDIIRGVNIGGWLILEKWMTPDVFDGTSAGDQYTFDSTSGAQSKLENHWNTYFTEDDVIKIASSGINTLRIPIGYWAFDNSNSPYLQGAEPYLDKAIGWARTHGLKVIVDCHGSPGSQNGFDNSGRSGVVEWQSGNNMAHSIDVLKTMATKYGSTDYADVVFALELANEPISWGANNFDKTRSWTQEAYNAVKSVATNSELIVVMHDGFMGARQWLDVSSALNGQATHASAKFALDVHLYQNQVPADSLLNQPQHIAKACAWSNTDLLGTANQLQVIVGEFSAQTNICANPDGSTVAGSTCWIDGCQCSSNVDTQYWKPWLVDATRQFLEAELDAFEHSAKGWILWSYKGPGPWGFDNLQKYGILGQQVTDRKYPKQCGF